MQHLHLLLDCVNIFVNLLFTLTVPVPTQHQNTKIHVSSFLLSSILTTLKKQISNTKNTRKDVDDTLN